MPRDNRCMCMTHVCYYVCCSDCVGVCGNVCCVAAVVKEIFLTLECWSMLYICVRGVMDVVYSVCIETHGAVGDRVWEVCVFRHADVVCLCLVCILGQFSTLYSV